MLSGNAPFSPVLQLEIDSGVVESSNFVSEWQDSSGSANHLFADLGEQPEVGLVQTPSGTDAIRFDGSDDRLIRSLEDGAISSLPVGNSDRTVFLVAQFHDAAATGGATYGRFGNTRAFGLGASGPGTDAGDVTLETFGAGNDLVSSSSAFNPPGTTDGWMVISTVHSDDGSDPADNGFLFRDGVEIAAWSQEINTKINVTTLLNGKSKSRLVVGEGIFENGAIQMDVAAWLVYDGALSDTDRQTVENYLTQKYLTSGPQPPTAANDLAIVDDGAATIIDVVANDTDPDGTIDPTTVTIVDQPTHAAVFSVDPVTGAVSYTHDGSGLPDSFTYTVTDDEGLLSNVATVTINLTPPNQAPTATDDSAGVLDGAAAVINVIANDVDPDGTIDPTTVTIVDQPTHAASISIDPVNGAISYTHDGSGLPDTFTYTVDDDEGLISNIATVTISLIVDPPFAPVFRLDTTSGVVSSSNFVSEWQDLSGSGNHLFAVGSEQPQIGIVQTPTGVDAVRFDGDDDRLIRALGDGPISNLPDGNAGRTVFLVAQFFDAEATGGATYGRFGNQRAFGVGVSGSGADAGDVTLQTWGVGNDLVSDSSAFSPPGTTTGWMVISTVHTDDGSDPSNNGFLYRDGVEIASWDQVINTKNNVTSTFNGKSKSRIVLGEEIRELGHLQMDVASWLVYDSAMSNADRQLVEFYLMQTYLGVSGGNISPSAGSDSMTIDDGTSVNIDVVANDVDVDGTIDPTTVTIVGQPAHATSITVDPITGVVSYTHDGSGIPDSFTYTVKDDEGAVSNVATVSVNLSPPNQPPTASDDFISVNDEAAIDINVLLNDTDSDGTIDPTTVTIVDQPVHATSISVDPVTGVVSYTHDGSGFSDSFTYTVNDDEGLPSNLATVSISLTMIRESSDPAFGTNSLTVDLANGLAFLDLTFTENMSFNEVAIDPAFADYRYATVAEITNLFTSAGITAINELPFRSTSFSEARALSLLLGVTSNETGNSPATKGISDDPSLIKENGPPTVRYTPYIQLNLANQKQRSFSSVALISQVTDDGVFLADDANKATIGHWLVKISDPDAVDDLISIDDGDATLIDVVANDIAPNGSIDPTTVIIIDQPAHATSFSVDLVTGEVSYAHDGSGLPDSFTYTVNDNTGIVSNVAIVTINIAPPNQAPTANDDFAEVDDGDSANFDVVVNDTDSDGTIDPTTVTIVGQPAHATSFSVDPVTGVVSYTHDGSGLPDSFTYTVNDDEGLVSNLATVTINLAPPNQAPTATDDSAAVADGASVDVDVVANDTDPDGSIDPTTVTIIGQPTQASSISVDPVTGVVSYAHDGSGLPDSFTYTVNDNEGLVSNFATVNITVTSTGQPLATGDSYSVLTGETLDTAANSLLTTLLNDHDGNPGDGNDIELTAVLVTPPTNGTLTLDPSGHFVYVHDGSSATSDSFTYRADNGTQTSNIVTVDIQIVDGANLNVVRWHGDYYQHKWIAGIPGGTPSEFQENRWLRGGPALGSQHSTIGLDLDNDGQFDDSRVFFDFSLTDPLNPRDTPQKPSGVFYHSDLPSAQFYGGLSTKYFNYESTRIKQAFIENDGAGGEVADIGYISPYLGPADQGTRDFIESVRHADGRTKKAHIGVQEDFAINIYRPGFDTPVGSNVDPSDDLTAFSASFIWKKEDFLNAGDANTVSLDSNSVFSFESTRWWDNVGEARWIIQDGTGTLYISQFTTSGAEDLWGQKNELVNPLNSQWAIYTPSVDDVEFDSGAATFVDPVAAGLFTDIQAFGIHVTQTVPSAGSVRFALDEIRFDAVVTKASASFALSVFALPSAPANTQTIAVGSVEEASIAVLAEEPEEAIVASEELSAKLTDDAFALLGQEDGLVKGGDGEDADIDAFADALASPFWTSLAF